MDKVNIYFDMDGTLAKWRTSASFADIYKEGYFWGLEPEIKLCEMANSLATNRNVNCYILTSVLEDSLYAKIEKIQWAQKYIPAMRRENILCVPYGVKKASFVEDVLHRELSLFDFLIDDHSPNLISWDKANGKAIKWLNKINNSKKSSFSGARVDDVNSIERIIECALIARGLK